MTVNPIILKQLFRRSLFRHASVLEYDDLIGARYSPHPVGDNQDRLILH